MKFVLLGHTRYNGSKGINMPRRETLKQGFEANGFKFVRELPDRVIGKRNRRFILAICPVCETEQDVRLDHMKDGRIKSCGCEFIRARKDGDFGRRYHSANALALTGRHNNMMQRCYNKKDTAFHNYGGRGVEVCQEWHNRETFVKWGLENGFSPELDLDKDKLGDGMVYSPDTCCFLTRKENLKYRRKTK